MNLMNRFLLVLGILNCTLHTTIFNRRYSLCLNPRHGILLVKPMDGSVISIGRENYLKQQTSGACNELKKFKLAQR